MPGRNCLQGNLLYRHGNGHGCPVEQRGMGATAAVLPEAAVLQLLFDMLIRWCIL
jgi:hypothetical protein